MIRDPWNQTLGVTRFTGHESRATILLFPRLVLGRIGRPDQRIGAHLDRFRKFFQVLGDVEQIIEKLIDIFRVHIKRLVELPGQIGQGY